MSEGAIIFTNATLAPAGGGSVTGADNGLSVNGTTVELGQDIGAAGDPAGLTNAREIPLNGFTVTFGKKVNSVGRVSVENFFTTLNVHSFDDYSTLNPTVGGFGFGTFDASTQMAGTVDNDHFQAYQARLLYTSSGNLPGPFGMTGLYVLQTNNGTGIITHAHGVYIQDVAQGTGVTQNKYGIRIKSVIGGTIGNYAILSEGGLNQFDGPITGNDVVNFNAEVNINNGRYLTSYGIGTAGSANVFFGGFANDGTRTNILTGGTGIYSAAMPDITFSTFNGTTLTTYIRMKAGDGTLETKKIIVNNTVLANEASSILQVDSTTQGFLPPRMTQAQRLAIASPAVGLIVYQTDLVEGLYVNKSGGWTFVA